MKHVVHSLLRRYEISPMSRLNFSQTHKPVFSKLCPFVKFTRKLIAEAISATSRPPIDPYNTFSHRLFLTSTAVLSAPNRVNAFSTSEIALAAVANSVLSVSIVSGRCPPTLSHLRLIALFGVALVVGKEIPMHLPRPRRKVPRPFWSKACRPNRIRAALHPVDRLTSTFTNVQNFQESQSAIPFWDPFRLPRS